MDKELVERIAASLETIANAVSMLAAEKVQNMELNLKRQLNEYPGFNWASIGAEEISRDEYGATEVFWGNQVWTRRRSKPDDQYGMSVWFNRTNGRDEHGVKWLKLITFSEKTTTIKPMSADLKEALPRSELRSATVKQLPSQQPSQQQQPEELSYFVLHREIQKLLADLKWSEEQKKGCFAVNFSGKSYGDLTDEELTDFLAYLQIFVQTTAEIKRLKWNSHKGRSVLQEKFGSEVIARHLLTFDKLVEFLKYLQEQR